MSYGMLQVVSDLRGDLIHSGRNRLDQASASDDGIEPVEIDIAALELVENDPQPEIELILQGVELRNLVFRVAYGEFRQHFEPLEVSDFGGCRTGVDDENVEIVAHVKFWLSGLYFVVVSGFGRKIIRSRICFRRGFGLWF